MSDVKVRENSNLSPASYPESFDRVSRMLILAFVNSGTAPEAAVRLTTSLESDARAEATQAALVKGVLR